MSGREAMLDSVSGTEAVDVDIRLGRWSMSASGTMAGEAQFDKLSEMGSWSDFGSMSGEEARVDGALTGRTRAGRRCRS